ncbi:hypothetical protein AC579_8733 [Pseudocercospora musae]|uniref:ER transporter 6TM N-terminal domain-containing protein n=1 Tax=Pseudocercospora musae TaxID=113226 RepID=A0A139IWB9_9PEZI|nr:hypothetical protein AC579_8733 [Pseudocercospora musae]KXT19012.1 hypothetical protein AC579_8733 [Pseudocercospora musae]KXT19013.1 hypothetical protein AC579_8733 [Pseudocercospora musae]
MYQSTQDEKPLDGGVNNQQNGGNNSTTKATTAASETPSPSPEAKKRSKFKRIWTELDLDMMTVMLMFKASLPPTIAIAFYQAQDVAAVYQTLGYLIAITSVLGMCIMPRGMFMQTMLLNCLSVGVAASMNLLALYCATQARAHTTAPGAPPTGYNSSASAVLAVWLIFQTYLVNSLRSALPQFQFPVIIYMIFTCVSMTYGTQFPTMSYAISFMERLLEAFLTGFALATGVSLLVIPISCRTVVLKQMAGYLNLMGALLNAQAAYLESLETWHPEQAIQQEHADREKNKHHKDSAAASEFKLMMATPQGKALKALLPKIYALHTKIPTDINFAKREVAIGKLSAKDITELWKKMRVTLIPVVGLSSVIDILQRRAESAGWSEEHPDEVNLEARRRQIENLHQLMKNLHKPVQTMSGHINLAFQHALVTLELTKAPKKKPDEENRGEDPVPGSSGFAEAYRHRLDDFFKGKKHTLREWCAQHEMDLPADFFESTFIRPGQVSVANEHAREKDQRQLFFALYIDHLLHRAGQAALELVLFADKKKQDGALSKTRLIVPGIKTLKKWAYAAFGREDYHDEDNYTADLDSAGTRALDLGESYGKRRDPEHEEPRNVWERFGEFIRLIPRALRSDHSAFGFRVVAATMTVAIICYLRDSQTWFLRNRILWAMIMVPISMTRTAGQSTQSFILRILGTLLAMITSYVIFYIVDKKTPGVIVFLWLWIFLAFYIPIKFKNLIIIGVISIVTAILIIGYELQVEVVGIQVSESNGQPAYETYLLAPYRLATVCGGLAVAYIWTIFPYPVSESTELRKDIGASLYLLANLTSIVHETVKSRILRIDGDETSKGSRAYHLEKPDNKSSTNSSPSSQPSKQTPHSQNSNSESEVASHTKTTNL